MTQAEGIRITHRGGAESAEMRGSQSKNSATSVSLWWMLFQETGCHEGKKIGKLTAEARRAQRKEFSIKSPSELCGLCVSVVNALSGDRAEEIRLKN